MLPAHYSWLSKEAAPALLVQALKLYGTTEYPGRVNNADILGWATEVGGETAHSYNADEIPWCGLFMAVCCQRAGLAVPANPLWALSWSAWGKVVPEAKLGDVLVFTRKGGGHVGIYVGEDKDYYHVLGGNQGDAVCIKLIAKARRYAVRRTAWKVAEPANVRRVWLNPVGEITENEA